MSNDSVNRYVQLFDEGWRKQNEKNQSVVLVARAGERSHVIIVALYNAVSSYKQIENN